jgi:outer membrane protein
MNKIIVSFLALLIAAGVVSAKVYTLEECLQLALQQDPQLTQSRNAITQARAGVWQQGGQFLPTVSASLGSSETRRGPLSSRYGMADPYAVADVSKYHDAGFSIRETLFDGFRNVWDFLGSKAVKRQSENQYISNKSNLQFVVKTDYYFVLKSKRDMDVAQETVKRSEELLKLFDEKYQLGSASLSEVLKQKVQYGNDQLTLVRAQKTLKTAYDQLALDIGVSPSEEFDVADRDLVRQAVGDLSELTRQALAQHPAIVASGAAMDDNKYRVRSAWGWYWPTLSVSYSYGWTKDHFSDLIKFGPYDHTGRIAVSLDYTIFDGFTRERNLVVAKVGYKNSKTSYYYTRNMIVKQLEDAYWGIKLAEETLKLSEETERAASEDMQLVQTKYNLGAAAMWELLNAQVSLKEAQFGKVKAEFDYNLALAKLQNALGE